MLEDTMNEIKINTETIKLDQFLKLAGVVNTGGEAKLLLRDEVVYVNDELCVKRGKTLKKGDMIQVIVDENLENDHFMSIDLLII